MVQKLLGLSPNPAFGYLRVMGPLSYELLQTDAGVDLIVKGAWTSECQDIIEGGAADGLVLNYALGFAEPDLDFLGDWPIARLNILARYVSDLTPVYRLARTLRQLDVLTAPSASLDLSRLRNVQVISADWHRPAVSVAPHGASLKPTCDASKPRRA